MLIGAALALGGVWLISLGGSWYYLIAGAGIVLAGALVWRGSALGAQLYWLALAGTLLWGLSEVGADLWALMPRVLAPALIGLWLAMPWVRRKLDFHAPPERPDERLVRMNILTTAAAIAFMVLAVVSVRAEREPRQHPASADAEAASDWPQVGHDLSGDRFAALMQINPDNVSALHRAWTFHTGSRDPTFEATPILAGNLLVFCTARDVVFALDPETGEQRWRYDPRVDTSGREKLACRGVAYAPPAHANAGGVCAARVYVATVDARLVALDARTGQPCARFGHDGVVSLMEGIGDFPRGAYSSTSPPLAADGLVVAGAAVHGEGQGAAPSGVIRAFDAETAALRWAWDLGRPDRHGAPPPGETYTQDTPNSWGLFSADLDLGLVYLPMGNPSPDFWGGRRRNSDEHYDSAIVALDLRTGAPRWSFQTTHHDLWDYDLAAQPVLVDLSSPQGVRHALVQATKRGDIFVLDRATGQPIFPVEERHAPHDAAPGDNVSSTQPYSTVSLAPHPLAERDMWGLTPLDQLLCRIRFRELRYDGAFTPPGLSPSLQYPGAFGVMDWGGLSVDPQRNILVANTSAIAYIQQLVPRSGAAPQQGAPFTLQRRPFLSQFLVPCTAPPWGKLSAIDMATGRLIWSHPLGTAYDSGPAFSRSHLPLPMGVPNLGGAITTRSGLTFVAASVDHYLRAFDTHSGRELWRARLPAAGHATPMTFVGESGRQFVVIAAGGNSSLGPRLGDAVIAFSLPANLVHDRPETTAH